MISNFLPNAIGPKRRRRKLFSKAGRNIDSVFISSKNLKEERIESNLDLILSDKKNLKKTGVNKESYFNSKNLISLEDEKLKLRKRQKRLKGIASKSLEVRKLRESVFPILKNDRRNFGIDLNEELSTSNNPILGKDEMSAPKLRRRNLPLINLKKEKSIGFPKLKGEVINMNGKNGVTDEEDGVSEQQKIFLEKEKARQKLLGKGLNKFLMNNLGVSSPKNISFSNFAKTRVAMKNRRIASFEKNVKRERRKRNERSGEGFSNAF